MRDLRKLIFPFYLFSPSEPHHENWPKHKKHVFILSSAGKPIYSRYGDESSLAGFVGVLQAIVSFIADDDDTIR
jgi:vacuolar fusion protein MON1